MAARRNLTIRVKTIWGRWETFGSDIRATGITPEHVQLVADHYGPKTASFDLRRDPIFMWPDLQAFNPIEVEMDGVVVWSGRIKETPSRLSPDDRVISVQAEGWQAHLDDDPFVKKYAHTRLSDYQDMRSFPNAVLGAARALAAGLVSNDRGVITLALPQSTSSYAAGAFVGVILDLGPSNSAKRVVLNWQSSNNTPSIQLFARGSDSADPGTWAAFDDAFSFNNNTGASGTTAGTFTTARRYVHLFLSVGTAITPGADVWFKLKGVQVFTNTAYESGNASILKASTVVSDAVPHAPLLDPSTAEIAVTAFSIPDFAPSDYKTPREYIDAVNAFHNYVTMVNSRKRVVFKPQPSSPIMEVGAWSGYSFEDASSNSGEDLYNKVYVQGTGPDGASLTTTSTDVSASNLITRQGFTRTKTIQVDAALTTTAGQQIGDTYLAGHKDIPFKGTVTVVGPGAVRDVHGPGIPAERVLLMTNELLRLNDQINPSTGALGREGRIAEVTYDADEDQATIALDNTRANFEALLSRYAVVVGSAVQ